MDASQIRNLNPPYDLLRMIGKWFVVGLFHLGATRASVVAFIVSLGAGIEEVLISDEIIKTWLGYALHSVPPTSGISSIMEVCSEGTVPIVGNLYSFSASPRVVFAMLMGGVATDLTEIGTIWTALGKRTVIATLLILTSLTLVFGVLINLVL